MSAVNEKALNVNPGIVEVAVNPGTIPALSANGSNAATVRSACDALTFTRLASVVDVKLSDNRGANVVKVETDDNGTIYNAAVPEAVLSGSFFEVGDSDAIALLTGKSTLDVAASPVSVTTEIILAASAGSVAKGAVYVLRNKNGANTIVSSIVVDVDGTPLVLDTGYTAKVDTDGSVTGEVGNTYLTFLAATTNNKQVDVDYSYTPNAATYVGETISSKEIPSLVVRVTSTDPVTSKVKKIYLIDAGFEGELVTSFVDVARSGNLEGSPFSFKGNRSGTVLQYTDDL